MGSVINLLRDKTESIAKDKKIILRGGGIFITVIVVFLSCLSGWLIERLFLKSSSLLTSSLTYFILTFSIASSLASTSLKNSVLDIINELNNDLPNQNIHLARRKLSLIVGRDVNSLDRNEILRATAESASENAIDGIFAPLFWIMVGTIAWNISTSMPGPLAFAWLYKSSSTIDSMLGYKQGTLRWIGQSGAHLDDILTFIPCRLVVITLPFVSNNWLKAPKLIKKALKEGASDPSPNSGLSEAIFANCLQIRMGGENKYNNLLLKKPILASKAPLANIETVKRILNMSLKLEIIWILFFLIFVYFIV